MKFLRLNRTKGRTNLFNLDNVTNVYIDDDAVSIEFVDGSHFRFGSKECRGEYEFLAEYFVNDLSAHTINIDL